ncbi:MAG: CsbD family protein [Sphingomonas sp.]|nr:CsbD family protein [Sphingomonas sp.]
MGELIDKAKGLANEAAGNVKQAIGEATNNPKTKAEGMAQELKGKAQKVSGSVKGAFGDKV